MNEEKYRVLILDDDDELGELLREYLQNTRQCDVTYVNTVPDFWECLSKNNYDILFLDYRLPNANGLEILAHLGEVGITIPTVMMTGEGSENIAARAIQTGALDYLVKGEMSLTSLPPLIHKAVRLREMQRAMQQYLEQVRFQAMLLDNMRDAVVVWGLDGKITYWNTAAEQLYGVPAADRLGQTVQAVYFPCFEPPIDLPDLGQTGNIQLEHRCELATGEKIWVSTHITTLYNEGSGGEPIGYMNVARDITPRKLEQEALVKSQHFVQRILDTSPNIIYTFDVWTQRFGFINPEVQAILGYPVDTFAGASFDVFAERVHPADRAAVAQHLHDLQSMREGQVLEIEYRFITQKQESRWLKTRETVFSRREDGLPAEIIGVIQDITASKLAQEKLQHRLDSERMLSTISNTFINLEPAAMDQGIVDAMETVGDFVHAGCGAIFLLEEGHIAHAYSTPQARCLTEDMDAFSPTEAPWLFRQMQENANVVFNHLDDLPDEAAREKTGLAGLGLNSLILIPMLYNNNLYGALCFAAAERPLPWAEDDLYVLRTFGEMITNALVQKQVDQALRKSEARYRAIVEEHQTEMICRFLPDTTLTFVNEAYCKYYGLERACLVGTSFLEPVLDDHQPYTRDRLESLSTDTPVSMFEHQVRLPGGEVRWQEWVGRAIFDPLNDFIEFQAVGRDITERKRMEEQVKNAQTHLTQAARLASIGALASGVAHQISNPLTTIIADAQLLTHQLETGHPARESVEAIVQAGWRAQQVITELMKFSEPDQARQEPVDINETIQAALLLAGAHIQTQGVRLDVLLAPNLPTITANPRRLTDLWVNLLLLARSAFRDEGEHCIRIHSEQREPNLLCVDLTDDGTPIPSDQYESIFEPQLLPTGEGRGTGIELSVCREIVRQNRGQISISGSGQETTFHITFALEG